MLLCKETHKEIKLRDAGLLKIRFVATHKMWLCLPMWNVLLGGPSRGVSAAPFPAANTSPSALCTVGRQSQKIKQKGWKGLVSISTNVLNSRKAHILQWQCLSHKAKLLTHGVTLFWDLPILVSDSYLLHLQRYKSSPEYTWGLQIKGVPPGSRFKEPH